MSEDDIEIKEPSEYQYNKDEVYSHSSLVMSALRTCMEKRAKEMRDGYTTTKFDRLGNAFPVNIPDSRQEFIESVESLIMIQERDYDEDAETKIKEIFKKLNEKYEQLCLLEEEEWKNMPSQIKQHKLKEGEYFRKGYLSNSLPYSKEYIRYKVTAYTRVVAEIQKSIKRLGEYKEEIWEA